MPFITARLRSIQFNLIMTIKWSQGAIRSETQLPKIFASQKTLSPKLSNCSVLEWYTMHSCNSEIKSYTTYKMNLMNKNKVPIDKYVE